MQHPEIVKRRAEIDQLDAELVRLLNRRTEAARRLGEVKRGIGLPVLDAARELEVLSRVRQRNQGPLDEEAVMRIFRRIMRESRRIESQMGGER